MAVRLDADRHELDVAELFGHEAVARDERVRVSQLLLAETHAETREPLAELFHYATAVGCRGPLAAVSSISRLGSHGIIARSERPTRSISLSRSAARVA